MSKINKQISEALEAPNIGTNKMFININGQTSKLETNQNSKIQYKLNNPFTLDIGDKVTLYQAFVNEAGLDTDTITFQEDINSTIKFLYYMPSQLFMNAKPGITPGATSFGQNGETLQGDAAKQCLTFSDYQDFACFPSQTFLARDPTHENNASGSLDTLLSYRSFFGEKPIPFSDVFGGDMGTPYYLFENHHNEHVADGRITGGSNAYIKPAYGEVTIKIPAGNYEANSLAKNITEQFNGAFINDANNSNFLTDRMYNPDSDNYVGTDTANPFGNSYGEATTKIEFFGRNNEKYVRDDGLANQYRRDGIGMRLDNNVLIYNSPTVFQSDLFISPDGLELWERNTSNTLISDTFPVNATHYARQQLPLDGSLPHTMFLDGASINTINTEGSPDNVETFGFDKFEDRFIQYMSNNLLINVNSAPVENQNWNTGSGIDETLAPNRYCGTHSFTVSYSDDKANKFSIKNLHEPFKLPSITETQSASTFGAQQATKYNCINPIGNVPYPVDASMGIMVNNFGFDQVKNTEKYQELKTALDTAETNHGKTSRPYLIAEYNLNTAKFTDFFKSERDAKFAWSKTLWSRLGFKYEQLGDLSKTIETVQTIKPFEKLGGNFSATQERLDKWGLGKHKLKGIITHNDFDFSDIQACANLGAEPVQVNNINVNVYDSVSFANIRDTDFFLVSSLGAVKPNPSNELYNVVNKNNFSVMSTSQSIDADLLPNLNAGNSYYLITSDIVKPNGLDANGDPMNLLGIMSKENSSNDTIYSVDGVPNIITEKQIVTELSIEIRNPDNSLVPDSIIGQASGFILMVEKAINPNLMEVKSL